MNDAPDADETVKELDIGKVEVSGQTDAWETIPETIRELLSVPPLLDHENEETERQSAAWLLLKQSTGIRKKQAKRSLAI